MKNGKADVLSQYADALARVKYLRQATEKLEDRIDKFDNTDYGIVSDTVTKGKKRRKPLGTVKITGFGQKEYIKLKRNLKSRKIILKQREDDLVKLLSEAEEFIESISDIEMRNILSLYYIDDMTWVQVACKMNKLYNKKSYTPDACRVKHERFLKKF